MARAPDSRIAQAKELYLAGEKLIEIARQLGLPEGTVRRWKCTHKWDKADTERSDRKGSEKSERSGKKTKRRRRGTRTVQAGRRGIRRQSLRESMRLSFLIAWKSVVRQKVL